MTCLHFFISPITARWIVVDKLLAPAYGIEPAKRRATKLAPLPPPLY